MMNIKFIKLPKALFEGIYTELSSEGKLLYSLLLDRSLLSEKNSLTDDNGRVIVYFTNSEVCDKLKCSHDKATKLFRELERFKLICRHKQGKGKPDLIYVRQITRSEYSAVSNADNQDSGMRQISVTECGKAAGNNTDYSKVSTEKICKDLAKENDFDPFVATISKSIKMSEIKTYHTAISTTNEISKQAEEYNSIVDNILRKVGN